MFGGGGLKTFYTPQNCKTESGKFHERLTSVCVGDLKTFYTPPKIVSVCVGGLKTETGKFLLHFQNSKLSNRRRSIYGTDITKRSSSARENMTDWMTKKASTLQKRYKVTSHCLNLC